MKYGIMIYKETENIGDDIQSYAAKQFLPHLDYFLEREELDLFHPENDETVSVIMNGWYMYNKFNWPVSDFVHPLYIAMHFSQEPQFNNYEIGSEYLEGIGSEKLRQDGPVGCRDKATEELLRSKGIPCYFSGCLTLTLPKKFESETTEPYVCLVNVSDEVVSHYQSMYPDLDIRRISQEPMVVPNSPWEEREKNVEELLGIYQNATCVITKRLHCALPCLALETPVLLLTDGQIEESRFEGLYDLLHVTDTEQLLSGEFEYDLLNPLKNKDNYVTIREELIKKCQEFVKLSEGLPDRDEERIQRYYSQWEERAEFKQKIIGSQYRSITSHALKLIDYQKELKSWSDELTKGNDWLKNKNENQSGYIKELEQKNAELSEIIANLERELQQEKEKLQKAKESFIVRRIIQKKHLEG